MFSDITTQRQTWRAVISTAGMSAILLASHVVNGREPAGREDQPMITKRAFLAGHTGDEGRNYVRCVAFSLDGKFLASGGEDTTVRLWEVGTGKEKTILRGHKGRITCLSFSSDGKTLISGSEDRATLWDITTGKAKLSLPDDDDASFHQLAVSPDGKTLVSVSVGKIAKLWDLETGKSRCQFDGKWERGSFSFDGKTLALSGWDRVTLWDVATGKPTLTIEGSAIDCVAFSPDDKNLAVGIEFGNEEAVKLYEVATGRLQAAFDSGTQHVMSLAFSPDGKTLAVGRYLEDLRLWDVVNRKERAILPDSQYACSTAFSPDGKIIASGSLDGKVKLWDLPTTK